ncbi:SET domain-containing protein [Alcaligenes aquatilis]|uniref:SET domain-containing protein-lysine N-methyltransferase n=1 Tax=Alcaligenes faecalis TaxID=511 RepID=A0AB33CXT6_ALCFA|nr:SET domain-containing protein-lysine N-methyltransferase [Alcaligenes faecalis]ASR88084.1 SET domain-containing protein-lysine N-methyltransferase [Alcaligenes faecalis]
MVTQRQPWHVVKPSKLHGNGVFALRDIPAGTRILQYAGKRLTPEQADALFPVNPDEPFHTFFFALSNGKIVDGGQRGNDSRWINHSCAPNCEGHENADGSRVFIVAMRDIPAGQELLYDYSLVIDDEITEELKQNYRCLCGAAQCRGTMIALQSDRSQAVADELRDVAAELDAEMEQARKAPVSVKQKTADLQAAAPKQGVEKDEPDQDKDDDTDDETESSGHKDKKDKKSKKKKKDKAKHKNKNKDKKSSKKDKEGKKGKKDRKKE